MCSSKNKNKMKNKIIPHHRNDSKIPSKDHRNRGKMDNMTHTHMTAHFPGLAQVLQSNAKYFNLFYPGRNNPFIN